MIKESNSTPSELVSSFAELTLRKPLHKAIQELGFEQPSPIQSALIPIALTGQDVTGQARTGTGKTAAFGLPVLQNLDTRRPGPQAIILAPTR